MNDYILLSVLACSLVLIFLFLCYGPSFYYSCPVGFIEYKATLLKWRVSSLIRRIFSYSVYISWSLSYLC